MVGMEFERAWSLNAFLDRAEGLIGCPPSEGFSREG